MSTKSLSNFFQNLVTLLITTLSKPQIFEVDPSTDKRPWPQL